MQHSTISRRGGKARSEAKTRANRAKAAAFWSAVRAGLRPMPARPRVPPTPEKIATLLTPFCRENGITRLELFGSVARGTARKGSDVDLVATFAHPIGLRFFSMADDIAKILGVPVDLLTRNDVDEMTNPLRKQSILADLHEILSI